MKYRLLMLVLLLVCVGPRPVGSEPHPDVAGDAKALVNQLSPINLALGPLIDRAVSDGNDALAQRLEQLRSIIQEALFTLNKIITDATINVNSDAAARLEDLNGYVQDNLATFNGIAQGTVDALNESAKSRIDQLGDKAGNLVLALPIPGQPLPNVPDKGYSLVKSRTPGASTPLFITGAGLMRGGKRPKAFLLTGDSWTDYHPFSHNGTELTVSAASMGLIEIQIPESTFPKDGRVERTLVLALNSGAVFTKTVEPSFPLLLCSGLPKYSASVTEEPYGQLWELRTIPHPMANPQGELYIDSGTDGGTDTKRKVCANASDEGAGGWNADPNAGYHGLQYNKAPDGRPGTEHIGSFSDDGKGCINMYAARDSSGGGWAKMTGLAIHQRRLQKGKCGDTTIPEIKLLDYGAPTFFETKPQELMNRCAQLSEGAADSPKVRYHVQVLDEQKKVIDQADLILGGQKSPLVSGTVFVEADRYGLVKATITSRCLRSQ